MEGFMEKVTFTVVEVAGLLGIARNGAYTLISQGKLPALRLGRRLVVPKAALEKMLAEAGQVGGQAGQR
jgi:excisionase family DNA binding protein